MDEVACWRRISQTRLLSQDEWRQAYEAVFAGYDRAAVWDAAICLVREGSELVPAINLSAHRRWPDPARKPGEETMEDICYNKFAPEVRALNIVREAAGTGFLGGWDDFDHEKYPGSWCETHTRDEAIELLEAAKERDLDGP